MELLKALGVDWKILIAQLINFSILFAVLYKFGYKPLLNFLDERRQIIEKGINNAEKAQEKLLEIEAREKETIKKAKQEALAVLEKAKNDGEEKRKAIIEKAKLDIGQIVNQEKEKMQAEKKDTLREIKNEISNLVMVAVERVMDEKISQKADEDLIKKMVKVLNLDKKI